MSIDFIPEIKEKHEHHNAEKHTHYNISTV